MWEHEPELASPPDEPALRRFRAGQNVDQMAREQFPNGRHIPYRPQPEDMVPITRQAIEDGADTLFQATFASDDLLVKVDILTRTETGWHLIEVKSSSSVKEEHLPDAAFQWFVLQQAGLNVTQASIMHLNRECRYPDLSNLFILSDVTADVIELQDSIEADIAVMRQLNQQTNRIETPIGRHCNKPYTCRFHEECWQDVNGLTIYHLPRLKREKEIQLEEEGVLYLEDIPPDFSITAGQRAFVEFIAQNRVIINEEAIQAELDSLTYPLHFFDFETIDHAIPVFNGCRPYQQVPFQYSCHILTEDGALTHQEYLQTDMEDPRPALVNSLLDHIGDSGNIIVYYAPFERQRLQELADAFPQYAAHLNLMIDRLWDQLNIFKQHYRHYQFGNSNSLKSVLPVVVPRLSYEALAVQNGSQAQIMWEEMIGCQDTAVKNQLVEQLLEYCRLDTLAMVEIHQALNQL